VSGNPYRGYRLPKEIISYCVWLYFRFGVSFRDVEELMAARGVVVETVRTEPEDTEEKRAALALQLRS
jgi:transposase-like protein